MHTQSLEAAQALREYLSRAEEACKKVQSLLMGVRAIAMPETDSESHMLGLLNGNVACALRLLQVALQDTRDQEVRSSQDHTIKTDLVLLQ